MGVCVGVCVGACVCSRCVIIPKNDSVQQFKTTYSSPRTQNTIQKF